jgi:ribosomal protein S18 acetylase RimI-like enzyme
VTVEDALTAAERVLPGTPAPDGQPDPRWQAIIAVGEFAETHPAELWPFVERWGAHEDEDLRAAVATCLLEHLLQHHREAVLPQATAAAQRSSAFADTLRRCWTFDGPGRASESSASPGMACEIVDASPDDAGAILALQRIAYESEARRYDDWTIPPLVETLDSVRLQIAQHVVLKAIVDGRLAGSVRGVVTDGVCEVCRLSVDPALQRRGIGSALLVAIEQRFTGIEAFELFTGNRSVENLRLYERHGYRHARTKVLSPAVSLIFLRKPASSTPPST